MAEPIPSSSHTALTSAASTAATAASDDEQPFQLVRSKRRTAAPHRRFTAKSNYSSSSGSITATAPAGFAYAPAAGSGHNRKGRANGHGNTGSKKGQQGGEQDDEAREVQRACDAVDVFVRYLGSEVGVAFADEGEEKGEKRTYAQQLAATLARVWPPCTRHERRADATANATATSAAAASLQTAKAQPSATVSTAHPNAHSTADSSADTLAEPKQASNRDTTDKRTPSTTNLAAIIPTRIVCLGLGSPTSSRSAQIQLALLVVLRTWLGRLHGTRTLTAGAEGAGEGGAKAKETATAIEAHDGAGTVECLAYDPVFSTLDRTLLQRYGVVVASAAATFAEYHTNDGNDTVPPSSASPNTSSDPPPRIESYYTTPAHPTLLYMPHCDRTLYNHVLSLLLPSPVILLSNTLANYTLDSNLATAAPTLHALIPRFTVVELPNYQQGDKSAAPLVNGGTPDEVKLEVGRFGRLWDRNALRDLGFHWF